MGECDRHRAEEEYRCMLDSMLRVTQFEAESDGFDTNTVSTWNHSVSTALDSAAVHQRLEYLAYQGEHTA